MNATNGECQVCKKAFRAEDDIVICPECGAPYHRECYQQAGKCVYEDRHKNGFEYKNPAAAYAQQTGAAAAGEDVKGAVCSRCGTVNTAENIFCERCGQPLGAQGLSSGFGGMPFGVRTFEDAYYGGAVNMDGEIDGVKKRDWATFIGRSANDYIMKMTFQQQRNSMLSFTPSALLFPTFYFAYRKLWLWAAGSFVLDLLCSAPTYLALLMQAGALPGFSMPTATLDTLSLIASGVRIATRILMSLFAVYLYRRNAIKKIGAVTAKSPEGNARDAALKKAGGTSIFGVIGACLLYFLAGLGVALIGGQPFAQLFVNTFYTL